MRVLQVGDWVQAVLPILEEMSNGCLLEHANPGDIGQVVEISTDPSCLGPVIRWQKSGFVYDAHPDEFRVFEGEDFGLEKTPTHLRVVAVNE